MNCEYIDDLDLDAYLFHKGRFFKSYETLGAHLVKRKNKKGVRFVVWAPNANNVQLVGDFNFWQGEGHTLSRYKNSSLWTIFVEGLHSGVLYKYKILTKENQWIFKADPYAFYSEVRPKTASVVWKSSHVWKDDKWMKARKKLKPYQKPMNIYELHLGSWRRLSDETATYITLAHQIVDYVLKMGYTHIELLPLNEHPYDGSWGYQATGYFSVTSRYGSPDDFAHFIDVFHQNGVGVILDWVPCHFCKDEHGLRLFDGGPVFESAYEYVAENAQWGTMNFDLSRNEVWSFLISNAIFWFDKYHIDGLRVDAVAFMLYLDYGREHMNIRSEDGSNINRHAVSFLQTLNQTVFHMYPGALMIAEESTAWPLVSGPVDRGGLGFNFKWNLGWMNDILTFMKKEASERKWHQNLITFSLTYAFSENYILPLSHDEVVHGKKSLLNKMPGDYWQKFANLRLLYGYMMAHPGKKLLFMGGELGQFIEWDEKRELDWFLLDYDSHKGIQNCIKQLNHIYKKEPIFSELDTTYDGFEWIDLENVEESVIVFMRKGQKGRFVLVVCNFTPKTHLNYRVGVPEEGVYKEIFNSDDHSHGGAGNLNEGSLKTEKTSWHGQPFSLSVKVPPLATMYLKKEKTKKKVKRKGELSCVK